jgi:hypothetical protein
MPERQSGRCARHRDATLPSGMPPFALRGVPAKRELTQSNHSAPFEDSQHCADVPTRAAISANIGNDSRTCARRPAFSEWRVIRPERSSTLPPNRTCGPRPESGLLPQSRSFVSRANQSAFRPQATLNIASTGREISDRMVVRCSG